MQDIVFYAAANETLGMVRDYSNMNNASAPVLTLGVAVCLRIRLFADIKVPTPYPVASLNGIADWHWSMDADFDRSTACKLVADEGGISVHTVTDTINGDTMSFTEFVIPISNMNTEELAAWLENDGTKSGLTGELVGYDSEGHAVFVLQIEGFKVRNRVAGLSDPAAVDEGFVTCTTANGMIQTAVSALAATKQDKLTAGTGISITGGTHVSMSLTAGERMEIISGDTVAQMRYFDIANVTGGTVTLEAGHAYRLNATTGTKTLYAENMDDDTFGLEGHIEIFVANAGSIQTGKLADGTTEVILADALEPDAVNNCTVRFHDHKAIISVEDHVAGNIVTVSAGTVANSLYYWLTQPNAASDAATQYIGFDASLNGTPVNFEGAVNTAVKHVVGNGYTETILTGNVAPAAALTVSDLSLQNVTVTGGVMTIGDADVSGGIATSNGAKIVIEHARLGEDMFIRGGTYTAILSGGVLMGPMYASNGESIVGGGTATVIDLQKTILTIASSNTVNVSGCTFLNGSGVAGALNISGYASATITSCNFVSCGGTNAARGILFWNHNGAAVSGCTFKGGYGGTGSAGYIYIQNTSGIVANCDFQDGNAFVIDRGGKLTASGNKLRGIITLNSGSVIEFTGSNAFVGSLKSLNNSGFVNITGSAVIDMTNNTTATVIKPGSRITIPGGAVVDIIGSGGPAGSCGHFEGGDGVEIVGASITNTGCIYGATVTFPPSPDSAGHGRGPWDLLTTNGAIQVPTSAATHTDVISGGLYGITEQ